MEGSPSLLRRTPTVIPVTSSPYERDIIKEQAARISAVYHDKTEKKAPKATVGKRDSLRERILSMSLFPNLYNKKFVQSHSDATS
jgi:hypothetical protein